MADNNTTAFNPVSYNPTSTAAVNAGASLGGSIIGAVTQSIQNKKTREFNQAEAEKQRLWNEEMFNKQNAWNMEMWNKTNEYNAPSNQVQRLREAGLNPLFYGLDGSSAGTMSAATPLGYERAQADNQPNPFASLAGDIISAGQLSLQGQSIAKDIELKNAQIDKLKQEETGLKLDNEWKDKTQDARIEAETLRNSATKKQIDEAESRIKVNAEEVKKRIQETDNLVEQKGLIIAERILTENKAREIIEMLPYNKLLAEAQTSAQKAAASLSWAYAAIQNGLLEAGYVDKMIDDLTESARSKASGADLAEINKAINEFKLKIRNGSIFEGYHTIGSAAGTIQDIMNSLMSALSIAGEAIGGGLSGVIK